MIEKAKVLQRKASRAVVVFEKKEACSECFAKGSCRLTEENLRQMEVLNEIDAAEGDTVEVEISSVGIVRKTFLLYILPAVFFIAGMGFCLWAGLNEWLSLAGGFFCLIMAFFLVSVVDKNYSKKESLKPRIKRIIR